MFADQYMELMREPNYYKPLSFIKLEVLNFDLAVRLSEEITNAPAIS